MTYYSRNPFIRFYCGYVERLCKQYDNAELKDEAERLMHHDITNLTMIDNRLLYRHQSYITRLNGHYYTLRSLRYHDPLIWSYALVRHILLYDMLNDDDRKYIDKWINRLTYSSLISFYIYHAKNIAFVEEALNDAIKQHYCIVKNKESMATEVDDGFPLHRESAYPDTEITGLGCYIQCFEGRLPQWYSIKVKRPNETFYLTDYRDIPNKPDIKVKHIYNIKRPKYNAIPFTEKFLRDTFIPLLQSNVKRIVVNIDRVNDSSNDDIIHDFIGLLYAQHQKFTQDESPIEERLTIIVPDMHLNGCVARNITYSYIRTALRNNGLFWFGSDDDDAITTNGVNILCEAVQSVLTTNDVTEYRKILLFDPSFLTKRLTAADTGFSHYATWTYAFSPEYYNALSFPCTPLEKEDLDVFNRLMQHTTNIINLLRNPEYGPRLTKAPVYIYFGPNSKRKKKHELYETIDIIDYMNIHNINESVEQEDQAPATSDPGPIAWKVFYPNRAKRYYLYSDDDRDTYRTVYGISNVSNKDSQNDSFDKKQLTDLPREITSNENLNGDMYIVTYKAYRLFKNGKRVPVYGSSFQNGKSPYIMRIQPVPDRLAAIDADARSYPDVAHDLRIVIKKFDDLFTASMKPLNKLQIDRIELWNKTYLQRYRKMNHYVPLKTFGGKNGCRWWMILLLILLSFVIIVIVYRIVTRKELYIVQSNDSVD